MDLNDSHGAEVAREGPYLTVGRRQRACSRHEPRRSLVTQVTVDVSGNLLELDDRQMLPAGVVADHEDDLQAGLTIAAADAAHDASGGHRKPSVTGHWRRPAKTGQSSRFPKSDSLIAKRRSSELIILPAASRSTPGRKSFMKAKARRGAGGRWSQPRWNRPVHEGPPRRGQFAAGDVISP